jgi:hypothetical protein
MSGQVCEEGSQGGKEGMPAVHPDKVGHDHPGANQAAGRVNKVRLLRCYTLQYPALSGVKVVDCWPCTLVGLDHTGMRALQVVLCTIMLAKAWTLH